MDGLVGELSAVLAGIPGGDRVPAVSVAVLAAGAVRTAAWGATPDAVFQAASISKPVAAVTALRLVAEGRLALDTDVNTVLRSWRLPAVSGWAPVVTLRHLLCHGGALTVSGYPGYPREASLPALVEILDGRPPSNTPAVRVDGIPGLTHRYSGGGYVVLQQLLEDLTGATFAELATELVLRPAGMSTATYAQPPPERAACGHVGDGPVPGGWHVYPEQAAAGLWCTPTDLVRFAAALHAAVAGEPDALLPPDLAREMMSTQLPGWGLGVQLDGEGPHRRFMHGGSNHGYRCGLVATVAPGHAAAAMTNSEDGGPVARVLVAATARSTGWPDPPQPRPADMSGMQTAEAIRARYVGDYLTDTNVRLTVIADAGGYHLVIAAQPPLALDVRSDTAALAPAAGATIIFTVDEDGNAESLTVRQYGTEITANRR
ncbi:serine hydrolase domain-containing protein [Virgisporangium aurantiacum]|uniref:Beta-lactamase-related domain-containing protein n=1 Tax=Virgisporangium aurantiacum TaxID=175570 RepID=A0A8J3ZIP8_9ACTN|nr:serine hydrolase domain-containing protein [Virgisporangium aurantiacum]GIJ62256.1 hypothetical protein Vau01_097720 [Virgisporangium aurantiacum]